MNSAETLRATEQFLHEQIPLTRAMQVRVESFDDRQLTLAAPLDANHNHLGTAFGGSIAALAMLTGYVLLWLKLGDRSAHIVISESSLQFRRPVQGELRATCLRQPDELAAFRETFARTGKARLKLDVVIEANGETAVAFTGLYVAKN